MLINDAVNDSSPVAIKNAFQRVVDKHLPDGRWLGVKNRYRKDTINRIKKDLNSKPYSIKERQLGEYISVSTIFHCFDGWNYLSRAVESIIYGDELTSIHLAYYAELRAVMSLMATEGIGVFNNRHIWFDANEKLSFFNKGTHDAANELINEWANNSDKKSKVFEIINVNAKSLSCWIKATGYSHLKSFTDNLLKNWLHKWSIDLKLDEDKNIRNEVSYRPRIFQRNMDCRRTIEKITEIWRACEPTSGNGFSVLDSHLLRITLDEIYSKSRSSKSKVLFINDTTQSLGLSKSNIFEKFLLRSLSGDDHLIIQEAKMEIFDSTNNTYDCFPIICRALLLLRLSTGLTEKLLGNSKITKDITQFWWQNIGLNHGLWANEQEPIVFSDLYQDIAESLQALDLDDDAQWVSLATAHNLYAYEFNKLKQFQRVGLWGLGL